MIAYLRRLFLPHAERFSQVQLELMTKAGRRCAYDLRHAASCIHDPAEQQLFHDRAYMWLNVFNPGSDGKNYRHRLHIEIDRLETRIEKLVALCEAAGIDVHSDQDIPF